MVDQEKIIIMTKLALYEKKYKQKDQRKLNYFVEDYVYIRNFWTRAGITLITLLIIVVGGFKQLTEQAVFPTSLEEFLALYIMPYFWPWLIVIVLYTVLSTLLSGAAYKRASSRFSEYKRLLKKLNQYESQQVKNKEARHEM